MTHHNAITGTSKQFVANSYYKMMHDAKNPIKTQINRFIKIMLENNYNEKSITKDINMCTVLADNAKCENVYEALINDKVALIVVFNPCKLNNIFIYF